MENSYFGGKLKVAMHFNGILTGKCIRTLRFIPLIFVALFLLRSNSIAAAEEFNTYLSFDLYLYINVKGQDACIDGALTGRMSGVLHETLKIEAGTFFIITTENGENWKSEDGRYSTYLTPSEKHTYFKETLYNENTSFCVKLDPFDRDDSAQKRHLSIWPDDDIHGAIGEGRLSDVFSPREIRKIQRKWSKLLPSIRGTLIARFPALKISINGLRAQAPTPLQATPLQACCSTQEECASVIPWGTEECPEGTTPAGRAKGCYACSKIAPAPAPSDKIKLTPVKKRKEEDKTQGCCIRGRCEQRTPEQCGMQYGFILESDQECTQDLCQSLSGACLEKIADRIECRPWSTAEDCGFIHGEFLGNGVPCPDPAQYKGACRISDLDCRDSITRKECQALGGTWQGKDTRCPETGPCIATDATCEPQVTKPHCEQTLSGQWLGPNAECPPIIGCCDKEGQCQEVFFDRCDGKYILKNGCSDECPQPEPERGICVVNDTECFEDLTLVQCRQKGAEAKWSENVAKCPERGACYLSCPFGEEIACAESTRESCESFRGMFRAGRLCPADSVPDDAMSITPMLCKPTVCNDVIGFWKGPDDTILYLDLFKRAVGYPQPISGMSANDLESSLAGGTFGGFECMEKENGRHVVEIAWDNGGTLHLKPPITIETDYGKLLCTFTHEGEVGDICFEKYESDGAYARAIQRGMNTHKKPLLSPPFSQFVVLKANGVGFDISIQGSDVVGTLIEGAEWYIQPLLAGQTKEELIAELKKSYLMIENEVWTPKYPDKPGSTEGVMVMKRLPCIRPDLPDPDTDVPDIFLRLEIVQLDKGPYLTFDQVEAAIRRGEITIDSRWETVSKEPTKWTDWVCDD